MRLHHLWLAVVLGLIPSAINAGQTINGVPIEAIGAGRAYIMPDGTVTQSIGFKATPPGASQPSYFQRAVNFTKPTVGNNVKQFAKFAAYSAAFNGIILGVGWFMDSVSKDIYSSPATPQEPIADLSKPIWRVFVNGKYYYGTELSSLLNTAINAWGNGSPVGGVYDSGSMKCKNTSESLTLCAQQYGSVPYIDGVNSINANPSSPGVQPSASEIADAIASKLPQELLDKLSTHPETGAVKETQEILNEMTKLANQLAKEANPAATTATAPTATATANTTDALSGGQGQLPPSCIWFKSVCDFIEWFKPEPQPGSNDNPDWSVASMITEQELEVQSYSSGLGSGSCPADEVFTVYGTSLSYSYTPICDLAGTARIFTILSAYLLSIFIVLGIRR